MVVKICRNRGEEKSLSCFSKDKHTKDGHCFYCKNCVSLNHKMRPRPHFRTQTPFYKQNKNRHLKSKYGITLEQYNLMFNKQRGVCAVCGVPAEALKRSLAVDHNHRTGKIRGLLCFACNSLIGRIEKNPLLIPTMMKYIRTRNKK